MRERFRARAGRWGRFSPVSSGWGQGVNDWGQGLDQKGQGVNRSDGRVNGWGQGVNHWGQCLDQKGQGMNRSDACLNDWGQGLDGWGQRGKRIRTARTHRGHVPFHWGPVPFRSDGRLNHWRQAPFHPDDGSLPLWW
jgi:hypothetical protein